MLISRLQKYLSAEPLNLGKDIPLKGFVCDSRIVDKDYCFFALRGKKDDGHKYIKDAILKGAKCVVAEKKAIDSDTLKFLQDFKDVSILVVEDTESALILGAKSRFKEFDNAIVIGVAGSVGKSTTKKIIGDAASKCGSAYYTPKSFNTKIGLSLSVFAIPDDVDFIVFEYGTSSFGEIEELVSLYPVDGAVITKIGNEHLQYLKDIKGVLKAELEILQGIKDGGWLVVNADDDLLIKGVNDKIVYRNIKLYKSGYKGDHVRIEEVFFDDKGLFLNVRVSFLNCSAGDIKTSVIRTNLCGMHNATNVAVALSSLLNMGISWDKAVNALNGVRAPEMRMEVKEVCGVTLINDAYNANPDSMKALLDFLKGLKDFRKKIAILGSMKELGEKSLYFHRKLGRWYAGNVDVLVFIGPEVDAVKEGFFEVSDNSKSFLGFGCVDEFIEYLNYHIKEFVLPETVIAFKASRSCKFETLVCHFISVIQGGFNGKR